MSQLNPQVQMIQNVYAAFGKGDIPAILAHLSADAEFSFAGGSRDVPWHGPWRGREGVRQFFSAIAEGVEFKAFEPISFAAGADAIAVRLRLVYQVRRTSRVVEEEQVHWWTLRGGDITSLTHFEDTAQVLAAVR